MMYRRFLAAAAFVGWAAAQVKTDCDPLKKDCPADPALGADHLFHFNSTPSKDLWETTVGSVTFDDENGAGFSIKKQGDSPTLRTKFYFFFGRTELWLKAAEGKGVISSMMWLSDDLDEVDWEFIGANASLATTNYYGKGHEVFTNGGNHEVGGVFDDFHNYTTVWTEDKLEWFIDGKSVRTLTPDQANKTMSYPQTPMRLHLGIWAGGDPRMPEGTRKWAGGDTDYDAGPYTMYVKKAHVTDYSSGKEYSYGDRSGSWKSIKIKEGNSTALDAINEKPKEPEKSAGEKWAEMPSGAKAGIYAGSAAAGLGLLGTLIWYYIRQRKLGQQEAKAAAEREEAERREMNNLEKRGIDPDGFAEHGQEYDPRGLRHDGMMDSDSYHVPETSSAGPLDGGSWGAAAAVGAGAGAGAGAGRIAAPPPMKAHGYPPTRSMSSPRSPDPFVSPITSPAPDAQHGFDFGIPPPSPVSRGGSPAMPMQNQMRSGSAPNAFSRVGSPGPQHGYGAPQRMQSPGPMNGPARSFTNNQPGYRGPPQGHNYYGPGRY